MCREARAAAGAAAVVREALVVVVPVIMAQAWPSSLLRPHYRHMLHWLGPTCHQPPASPCG
jgi:hypothetical protein